MSEPRRLFGFSLAGLSDQTKMQSLKPTQVESSASGRFSDGGGLMFFYFASLNADILFKLALSHIKGVAQGHVQILMRLLVMTLSADHDMLIGNAEVDADVEEITLLLVLMIEFNCDPATYNVVAELLQFCSFLADFRFCCVGVGYAVERNL